jgi:pimeloyl-ACP methyl ester carboxylesterase
MAKAWAEDGPQEHFVQATVRMIVSPAPAEKWVAKWQSWEKANVIPMFDALLEREDITDRLAEIACPVVVVHGTEDPSIPMEKADALCAGLPGCRAVVRIDGGGHAANLSHPTEVNAALRSFLSNL